MRKKRENEDTPVLPAHLQDALNAYQEGRIDETITMLRRVVDADPKDVLTRMALASLVDQIGNGEEAEQLIDQVLKIEPENPDAQSIRGMMALRDGEIELAIELLEKALKQFPAGPAKTMKPIKAQYLVMLAQAYGLMENYEEMRKKAQQAIDMAPDSAEAWFHLAKARYELEDDEGSEKAIKRAIKLDDTNGLAHFHLGWILMNKGELKEAATSFERAIQLLPNDAETAAALGFVQARLGMLDEAIQTARHALELSAGDPDLLILIANTYMQLERWEEARSVCEQLIKVAPEDPAGHLLLGKVAYWSGDEKQFNKEYQYLSEADPFGAMSLAMEAGIMPFLPGQKSAAKETPARQRAVEPKQPSGQIYQLKVTIKGAKPPIWRRILVKGNTKLSKLHRIIQVAMGWTDSHLHQFTADGMYYADPDQELEGAENESRVTVEQVAPEEKDKILYEYDFGDGWEHQIVVEKILPPEKGVHYPVCITGKRSAPPEDIGGIWGYQHFLEAIKNPEHPHHEDMLDWVDEEFDPETFDIEAVNDILQRIR